MWKIRQLKICVHSAKSNGMGPFKKTADARGGGGRVKPKRQVSVREREGGFAKSVSWRSTCNFEQFTHGFSSFSCWRITIHWQRQNKNARSEKYVIHYKSRTNKGTETGVLPHSGPFIGCHNCLCILRMHHLQLPEGFLVKPRIQKHNLAGHEKHVIEPNHWCGKNGSI